MEKVRKTFKPGEIRDLIIAILLGALIFTLPTLKLNFFLYLIIISISMLLRHIAHKLMADRLGCMATFKLWITGTLIGMISLFFKAMFGFIFLAFGYVEIVPYKFGRWGIKLIRMTPRDYSYIALAGVGVNLFFMLFFGIWYTINPVDIFQIISNVNGLLAFFSLLPIPPLEGSHVFTWSLWFWVTLMFFTVLILIIV